MINCLVQVSWFKATRKSILESLLEVLVGDGTYVILILLDAELMADVGIWEYQKILSSCYFTLSDIGVSQMQHFFL